MYQLSACNSNLKSMVGSIALPSLSNDTLLLLQGNTKPPFNEEAREKAGFTREWYEPLVTDEGRNARPQHAAVVPAGGKGEKEHGACHLSDYESEKLSTGSKPQYVTPA